MKLLARGVEENIHIPGGVKPRLATTQLTAVNTASISRMGQTSPISVFTTIISDDIWDHIARRWTGKKVLRLVTF